ncbi:MAG: TIR domain-containing protein [Candidatus Hydrogenedentes bacterium]|nr:TIR domain-containing protein [Candidatus Hydrogenedentota bacterium]
MTSVFLSYARSDDEAFVRRLYADLAREGFTVWFDRESLMSRGRSFHQEIKDAIRTEVDRVVYIGGPNAAQSAYVREEWQFALECDHVVVTPILRLGDFPDLPGELNLLHCEDFRDDSKYPDALRKLIANLREPNPKLGALFAVPNLPGNFLGRPELMCRVRDALLVDLQKPQVITGADAHVGMQGMGGIGKSVLAAALARNRQVRQAYQDGVAWIACGQKLTDSDLLQRQRDLARHLGGDDTFLSTEQGKGVLRELLASKAVLLVLDDVWQAKDTRPFDVLGPSCRMLVTTRDRGILETLHGELVPVSLFTEREALQLLADAVKVAPGDLSPEAHEVARECGFLPLALALCGGMAMKRNGDFRSVLERLRRADLEKIADRASINEQHRDIWRAMQASVESLAADEQERFAELCVFATDQNVPEAAVATLWSHTAGLDDLDAEDLIINLYERSLIQLDQHNGEDGKVQRQFRLHDLLYDYAARIAGDRPALHRKLLDAYGKKSPSGWPSGPNDGYFLQNLCGHFIAARQEDELLANLLDIRWLEAKNEAGLLFGLLDDFRDAIGAVSKENERHRFLNLIDEAIRRDIHFIARHSKDYPQALFQCLWNSCWWYDCPDAANHYVLEQPTDGEIGYPWNQMDEKLSDILEKWQSQRMGECSTAPWIRSLRPHPIPLRVGVEACLRNPWGGDALRALSLSPAGKYVAVGGGGGDFRVTVYDRVDGQVLAEFTEFEGCFTSIAGVAFDKDERLVVAGGALGVVVWDIGTRKIRQKFEPLGERGDIDSVTALEFTNDNKLVTGHQSGLVRTWILGHPQPLQIEKHHSASLGSIVRRSTDSLMASSGWNGCVRVWDSTTNSMRIELQAHEKTGRCGGPNVTTVALSPTYDILATGSYDGRVRIWKLSDGTMMGDSGQIGLTYIEALTFAPCGSLLVIGGDIPSCGVVWDLRTGEIRTFANYPSRIRAMAVSNEQEYRLYVATDDCVYVHNLVSDPPVLNLRNYVVSCERLILFRDERTLATSGDNAVLLWDVHTGLIKPTAFRFAWPSSFGNLDSLVAARSGKRVFGLRDLSYGSKSSRLWAWDTEKFESTLDVEWPDPDNLARILEVSSDGSTFLWSYNRNLAKVLSTDGGEELAQFRRTDVQIEIARLSQSGAFAFVIYQDGDCEVWSATVGLSTILDDKVSDALFSDDGFVLYMVLLDGGVAVHDLRSNVRLNEFRYEGANVYAAFPLPGDTHVVAVATIEGGSLLTVRAFAANSDVIHVFEPARTVRQVAVSKCKKFIAIGASTSSRRIARHRFRVVTLDSGTEIAQTESNCGMLESIGFTDDSHHVVTFHSFPSEMRIWDVATLNLCAVFPGECMDPAFSTRTNQLLADSRSDGSRICSWLTRRQLTDHLSCNVVALFNDSGETMFVSTTSLRVVGFVPIRFERMVRNRHGDFWAGFKGNHLSMLRIEGL